MIEFPNERPFISLRTLTPQLDKKLCNKYPQFQGRKTPRKDPAELVNKDHENNDDNKDHENIDDNADI